MSAPPRVVVPRLLFEGEPTLCFADGDTGKSLFAVALAAYSVSGEYAMLKAAAAAGDLDERAAAIEALTSIRRAGADVVITYWAKELAGWL